MSSEVDGTRQTTVRLPKNLLVFSLLIIELIPFLARLPSVPARGWEWFTDYIPGISGLLFIAAFNLIPGGVLYGLGKSSKKTPLAFWFALAGGIGFLLWAHGTVNLRSSSTAAIALVFIPIYGAGAVVAGWVIGFLANYIVRNERGRILLVLLVGTAAIILGTGSALRESSTIAKREARFPIISVRDVPLSKRTVYSPSCGCRTEVLALDNFDSEPGNEIAVLNDAEVALLNPNSYTLKQKSDFKQEECDGCVHMYPYMVPDGKGSLLVTSSDGLSDSKGHLLWALKISGFTRLIPISRSGQAPAFVSYHPYQSIDRYDSAGKILWSVKLGLSGIGTYNTPEEECLPFALTGNGKSQQIKIFDLTGKLRKAISLPAWASNVQTIAWPKRGNLLVGGGSNIGVLDGEGKEILRHVIKDTSFNPYHGPDGTAVHFDPVQKPYLAIMSHGSSGYSRSVLLIFDPTGHLVWQEELNKLGTMLAVPQKDATGEVLLVGGMDGVIEYSLPKMTNSNENAREGR
jgi:hypothetical protein